MSECIYHCKKCGAKQQTDSEKKHKCCGQEMAMLFAVPKVHGKYRCC